MSLVFQRFQQFVEQKSLWYQGFNSESYGAIRRAENVLQVSFPATFQWLLTHYGYWRATGSAALTTLVAFNQQAKPQFPATWLILGREHSLLSQSQPQLPRQSGPNWIILLCDERPSYDGQGVLLCDNRGRIQKRYSGYAAYSMALQQAAEKWTDPAYKACLPGFHRNDDAPLQLASDRFDLAEFQRRLQETILLYQHAPEELLPLIEQMLAETSAGQLQPCQQASVSQTDRCTRHNSSAGNTALQTSTAVTECRNHPTQNQTLSFAETIATLTRWKRQQILSGAILLPPLSFTSDSSSTKQIKPVTYLETGQLLAIPCDSAGLLHDELISHLQPVCLLQSPEKTNEFWLIGWVPHTEIVELQLKMMQLYRTSPCWLMVAGESLAEFPSRLTQLQNA